MTASTSIKWCKRLGITVSAVALCTLSMPVIAASGATSYNYPIQGDDGDSAAPQSYGNSRTLGDSPYQQRRLRHADDASNDGLSDGPRHNSSFPAVRVSHAVAVAPAMLWNGKEAVQIAPVARQVPAENAALPVPPAASAPADIAAASPPAPVNAVAVAMPASSPAIAAAPSSPQRTMAAVRAATVTPGEGAAPPAPPQVDAATLSLPDLSMPAAPVTASENAAPPAPPVNAATLSLPDISMPAAPAPEMIAQSDASTLSLPELKMPVLPVVALNAPKKVSVTASSTPADDTFELAQISPAAGGNDLPAPASGQPLPLPSLAMPPSPPVAAEDKARPSMPAMPSDTLALPSLPAPAAAAPAIVAVPVPVAVPVAVPAAAPDSASPSAPLPTPLVTTTTVVAAPVPVPVKDLPPPAASLPVPVAAVPLAVKDLPPSPTAVAVMPVPVKELPPSEAAPISKEFPPLSPATALPPAASAPVSADSTLPLPKFEMPAPTPHDVSVPPVAVPPVAEEAPEEVVVAKPVKAKKRKGKDKGKKDAALSDAALSTQSKDIVDALPPEVHRLEKHVEPVGISRVRKNPLDESNFKEADAPGLKVGLREPKIDVSQLLENAYEALIAGNQEDAIALYTKALEAQPKNTLALFGLATAYHRAGQLQLARPLYGKLLAIDPHNVEGLNNFLVLLADESPVQALDELAQLRRSHPTFSPIPAQMAIIHERLGNYSKASEFMGQAIEMAPENLKYRYNMAIILDRGGDWSNAATFYQELLKANERGEKIPASVDEIQERLTFIRSNSPRG